MTWGEFTTAFHISVWKYETRIIIIWLYGSWMIEKHIHSPPLILLTQVTWRLGHSLPLSKTELEVTVHLCGSWCPHPTTTGLLSLMLWLCDVMYIHQEWSDLSIPKLRSDFKVRTFYQHWYSTIVLKCLV